MKETPFVTSQPRSQAFGLGMVLVSFLFFALLPNAAKIAYQEGANLIAVFTVRCIVGMLGLAIYLWVSRGRFRVGRSVFRSSAIPGAVHALLVLGMMGSVAYIDVSLAILIVFIHPFFIAIVEHFRGSNQLTPVFILCGVVTLAGLALALAVNIESLDPIGISLAVIGALSATVMVLMVVDSSRKIGAVTANFYMTFWASIYFIFIAIIGPAAGIIDPMIFPQSVKGWVGMLSTGFLLSLSYALFFVGAAIIGATRAAMISILEPLLTIIIAILLVGEWLTTMQWLGVVMIITSLFAMEFYGKESLAS